MAQGPGEEEIRKRRGERGLLYPVAIAASRSLAPRVELFRLPLFLSPCFRSRFESQPSPPPPDRAPSLSHPPVAFKPLKSPAQFS